MSLGEYNGAGSGTTKLLLHLNGNSTDSSGNSNNGTDTAITYSQANGKFGQGAGFNGSSSYIYGYFSSLRLTSNLTYSLWFKTSSTSGNMLVQKSSGSGGWQAYNIGMTTGGALSTRTKDSGTGATFLDFGSIRTGLNDNQWHLATFTLDGSGNAKLYIDGKYDNGGTLSGSSIYYACPSNNTPFSLGASTYYGPGGCGVFNIVEGYFNGSIDEVIIENRAWSAEEVKKYYTYTKGMFGIV